MGDDRTTAGIIRARRSGEATPDALGSLVETAPDDAPLTVAMIALTRFDIVNAAFGRASGDALLASASARIIELGSPAATIERGSGAAFRLMIATTPAVAARVLERIDAGLARPFVVAGNEANLGVRIGAAHRMTGEAATGLWRRAEEALDAARQSDGARIKIAEAPHGAPALRLAADLHRAIDRREIDILFQPQVSLANGAITGVEALARWEHPEHGVLGAEPLFAAAERADLGLALSEHIQAIALARAAAWPGSLAGLRVAVNVTAGDVARIDFAVRFLARVAESGLAATRVTAEITETGLIADLALAAAQFDALRTAGARVAIDDFGTGYSSLAYLNALPLDYLKIDRALVRDIARGPRDAVVARGVIAMARGLGLETIAEGVETVAQRDLLAAEGCTLYQGFLCAGPLDDAALAELVAR